MKWVRRVILISSGFITLLISIIAVGFALNAGATYLLLAMLIQPLIAIPVLRRSQRINLPEQPGGVRPKAAAN
jgi:hypothetical protein